MANARTSTEAPETSEAETKVKEIMTWIATFYGVAIVGHADYFQREGWQEDSTQLRELQLFIGAMVTEHDALADLTPGASRLVGKRGRKAGETKKVETADDVMKKLSRK
jgi:hypothetical protein